MLFINLKSICSKYLIVNKNSKTPVLFRFTEKKNLKKLVHHQMINRSDELFHKNQFILYGIIPLVLLASYYWYQTVRIILLVLLVWITNRNLRSMKLRYLIKKFNLSLNDLYEFISNGLYHKTLMLV